ncbi:MAG: hypothetical protein Q9163_000078 [Psora crenata]
MSPELSRTKDTLNDFESYGPIALRAQHYRKGQVKKLVPQARRMTADTFHLMSPASLCLKGHRWLPLLDGDKNGVAYAHGAV